MKKLVLIGMTVLFIWTISCSGKASQKSKNSAPNDENSGNGIISVSIVLKAFNQQKKVDGKFVPDVEAIVKTMQSLNTSVIKELTQENANSIDDFSYDLTKDGKGVSIRECRNSKNIPVVIVPETIEGITVTEIQNEAFWITDLIAIVLPETITKIGVKERKNSSNPTFPSSLIIINFPLAIKEIGPSTFAFSNLITAHLPDGLQILGEEAFTHCDNLNSVILPGSLKEIGDGVFSHSSNLASAQLLEGLNKLGRSAFYSCRNLTKLTLPGSLRVIPSMSFFRTGISELIIPEGVEVIREDAFSECFRLQKLIFPSTIKELYSSGVPGSEFGGPFKDCSNLTDIIFSDNLKLISFKWENKSAKSTFKGCGKLKLTVRQQLKEIGYNGDF
jgi:hypothetical protein